MPFGQGAMVGDDAVEAHGTDDVSGAVLDRIDAGDGEARGFVGGMRLDPVDHGFSGGLHFEVECQETFGFSGGEHFIGTHADYVDFALDVAYLAVPPVECHDATVQILHVEADVGKGVDQGAERRRVGAGGLEEVALQFLPFTKCHVLPSRF